MEAFTIEIAQDVLDDLNARLDRTRWIDDLGDDGWKYGPMFPKDLCDPPKEWAERFFNVQRWTKMSEGGYFAALEEPERLAADIRDFFRPFRA